MSVTKRRLGKHLGLAILAYLVFPVGNSGRALAVDDPAAWIKGIYATYAANKADAAALAVLKPELTDRLKRLIATEEACTKRSKGLCRLDFDPIVNAQDFEITDIQVKSLARSSAKKGNAGIVTATFKNGGRPNVIEFMFVEQGGRWLLDDIHAKAPGEETWVLSKLLGGRK